MGVHRPALLIFYTISENIFVWICKKISRIFSQQSHLRLVQYLMFLVQKKTNKLQRTKKKFHNAVYVITNLSVNLARVCVYIHRIKTSLKLSLALFISAIFKRW